MIFQRTRSLTFLLLLFFTGVIYSGGNPGFTYSGPTVVTVPYGSSTASGTYSFSYQNISGLSYPCLVVSLDGDVISSDLCNNPSTPSSFNISFTPGVHTVHFSLLSINPQTLNCYDVLVWQETEINVTCKFKVRVKNIFDGGIIYVDNLVSPKNAPYDRTSYTNDNFRSEQSISQMGTINGYGILRE